MLERTLNFIHLPSCRGRKGERGEGGASNAAVVSGTVLGAAVNMLNGNENPIFFAEQSLNY